MPFLRLFFGHDRVDEVKRSDSIGKGSLFVEIKYHMHMYCFYGHGR